jgi:hypothetical protein
MFRAAAIENVRPPSIKQRLTGREPRNSGVRSRCGDCIELRLVLRCQHGLGVTPEVGAGHCDDVDLVAGDELTETHRLQHPLRDRTT